MANTLSEALLVLTSWNTGLDDLTSLPTKTLVKVFLETTLQSDEVCKLYCTVLDVEVSEGQKKDAESVGVTLFPATRSKWAKPNEDPPGLHWLFNHNTYYRQLKDLQNIKHIVSFSPNTKNAATAIHESLFSQAQFHQLSPPEPNGVLFTFDVWSKHACGLAGYHRSIIQDFRARKAGIGEFLKAYTTVVDVAVSEEQKCDAKTCGVILIPAVKKKNYNPRKDGPKLEWLIEHKSYYPDLSKLKNIKYVVGFCPKTGRAAADIREQIFPKAKLVLINHVCPETNCLFEKDTEESEEDMLQMASEADIIFSVGPHIYEYFENAYRQTVHERKLSDIPHSEILPLIGKVFFDNEVVVKEKIDARTIITYGQLDTTEALEQCKSLVTHVGKGANKYNESQNTQTVWELHGASEHIDKSTQKCFINSSHVTSKFYPYYSTGKLLRSLQKSHLCVPPPCYTDYSFEGLEAMAAGLPIAIQNDCHIARMIERHFNGREEYCVAKHKDLAAKITDRLVHNPKAFENAKLLKKELAESEAIIESFVNFASLFTEEKQQGKQDLDVKELEQTSSINQQQNEDVISKRGGNSLNSSRAETEMRSPVTIKPEIHQEIPVTTHDESTTLSAESRRAQPQTLKDTTAVKPGGFAVTSDTQIAEATPMQLENLATDYKGITETKAMQAGRSIEGESDYTEISTMQPWRSETDDKEITETTAEHPAMIQPRKTKKNFFLFRCCSVFHRRRKIKCDRETIPLMDTKQEMSFREGRQTECLKNGFEDTGKVGQVQLTLNKTGTPSINQAAPPSSDRRIVREKSDDLGFTVDLNLNRKLDQQLRTMDEQKTSQDIERSRSEVDNTWRFCKNQFDKKVDDVITSESGQQTVQQLCEKNCGEVTTTKLTSGSLRISLDIPTQYNLYKLKHTCRSGSFPESFEPLLITDKMREEADKVGLQLKLQATYNQARFDELRHFFMNRDGGGLKPVEIHDDIVDVEDAEEIHTDAEETNQKSNTVIEGVADRISTEHRQYLEDIKSKSEVERATLECQLKEAKKEKDTLEERCKELTKKLESTEQSLVSQRIGNSREREKLQSELELKEKLIKRLQDKVTEVDHKKEQSDVYKPGEKGDGSGLKPVKVSDDVIEGKDAEEIHLDDEDTDQKSDTMITGTADSTALEDIQSKSTLESQLKEAKEERATLEEGCKEVTEKLESTEQSLVSQRNVKSTERREREKLQSELEEKEKLTKKLDNTVEEFKQNLEHSSQKKQAEKAQTSMPQQLPQHHHEMSTGHMMQASAATGPPATPVVYSQPQQMPYQTDQSHTQGTITSQMVPQKEENQSNIQSSQKPKKDRSSPQGHLTSPHHQGKNPIPQEIQTSATQVSGDWSVTLVSGQHQGQGQKFKLPSSLAFHRDKLVVCDTGNNIVQILNKDYTCDKVIGSFDGQFAKPFRPTTVAISRFNHYFILDFENKQIVVCDENSEIIKIITLPENIVGGWDIALMDDFVLVTLSLTSLDITRPEDRDDRLVKYTQSGEYVTEVSGQTSVQTKFLWPVSVTVNSKNVIMVYDQGNECIKCFDSDLNFLHQFGQSQLQLPRIESGWIGHGYIAVDEDDNVYVCGHLIVDSTGDVIREWIVKYGCDGKFICDLFKGHVSLPMFIAVMGDKIGVVEWKRDQIKVFSK